MNIHRSMKHVLLKILVNVPSLYILIFASKKSSKFSLWINYMFIILILSKEWISGLAYFFIFDRVALIEAYKDGGPRELSRGLRLVLSD